jgi:hypothetical protein
VGSLAHALCELEMEVIQNMMRGHQNQQKVERL